LTTEIIATSVTQQVANWQTRPSCVWIGSSDCYYSLRSPSLIPT